MKKYEDKEIEFDLVLDSFVNGITLGQWKFKNVERRLASSFEERFEIS